MLKWLNDTRIHKQIYFKIGKHFFMHIIKITLHCKILVLLRYMGIKINWYKSLMSCCKDLNQYTFTYRCLIFMIWSKDKFTTHIYGNIFAVILLISFLKIPLISINNLRGKFLLQKLKNITQRCWRLRY